MNVAHEIIRRARDHGRARPQAYVVSFGSAAVSFHLRVWTDRYEDWIWTRSNLAVAVDEALSRERIAVA
jgi:small-conductance mechanosensitive channel